jgi:flavin reductase (DIM6/NTAB) family NADH-FMN oxidoreductase RutF
MTLLTDDRLVEHLSSVHPSIPVDQDAFRSAMGQVCTPVSVVSVMDGDRPHGSTVSAFASQSMQPPMVLVSLASTSRLLSLLDHGRRFGLNVLGAGQAELAARFAGKADDKFAGLSWEVRDGAPALPGSPVWLACDVTDRFQSGDHIVVCGTVCCVNANLGQPLTYHGRTFGTHAPA